MRARSGAENHEDIFCLGPEVGWTRSMRMLRRPVQPDGRFGAAQGLVPCKQRAERDATQTRSAIPQEVASVEQPMSCIGENSLRKVHAAREMANRILILIRGVVIE